MARFIQNLIVTAAALLTAMPAAIAAAADETTGREVFVEQGRRDGSIAPISGSSKDVPLKTDGPRTARGSVKQADAESSRAVNIDFWFFDASTRVAFDYDGDGYFTRLELDFDVDTVFAEADVYARIFLSRNGGPWNELTTTAVFTIFGSADDDDYFVDTDLVSGFPTGSYDVLIELYDTFDGALVAEFGPSDTSMLFDLPLEDQILDEPAVIVHEHGGGGALALPGLLLLTLVLALRWRRRALA